MKEQENEGRGRPGDRDDLDTYVESLEDAGFAFPVRDETLAEWYSKAPERKPSERLDRRIAKLLQGTPSSAGQNSAPPSRSALTFGATLAVWRQEAGISVPDLVRRVGLHRDVIVDLEADEIYPETQSAEMWRRVAEALGRTLDELRLLIARTPRDSIHPQGIAAARLDRKHWRDRADFLTRDEQHEEAKLDKRRAELLKALED